MSEAFFEIRDLHTFYGAGHALQGISLSVEQGQIVCLLGRNGMGKSTTLKSVMGLTKPRSGTITFRGKQIFGLPPYKVAMVGIGYVPEERRIFPTLSVTDNLLLGIKGGKVDSSNPNSWTLDRIFQHFPALKLRANSRGAHLSGGEQQMMSIGRSLMGNPALLLVDEPTEGLAPMMATEVRNVLAEINNAGVSILLVEHNLKVAMSLAHKIYLMGKAHIGFQGTVEELSANAEIRAKYLEV
jgi:branched-chain amino acid transport system ATP-binding protein